MLGQNTEGIAMMETNSLVFGAAKEEENKASGSNINQGSCQEEIVMKIGTGRKPKDHDSLHLSYPDEKNLMCSKQLDDKLESAKSEMDEVMEENQMLRMNIDKILKDYRTLQMQYEEEVQKSSNTVPTHNDQLIALSLGRVSCGKIKDGPHKIAPMNEKSDEGNKGLRLGLDCKFEVPKTLLKHDVDPSPNHNPENSLELQVKEECGEANMKNVRDGDEILQQNPAKRARVSVRVRCDMPTMIDGCQWRKYGQKIAKGNPCPRAYYRCTVAPSCPVRKQVQRCMKDMSILITTYEGTHNHPLSASATAMAATTSAAASMLLSGSSTSEPPLSTTTTTSTPNQLNGLNFHLSHNSRSVPFYLPNSSISSSPNSCPTITLDLASGSSSSSYLSRLGDFPTRYPTTNLNFSSLKSSGLPNISWNNGILGYSNKNQTTSSLSFGSNPNNEILYRSNLQKSILNPNQQTLGPDTISAATKAITSDPSFRLALAAALSSIIGSGDSNN